MAVDMEIGVVLHNNVHTYVHNNCGCNLTHCTCSTDDLGLHFVLSDTQTHTKSFTKLKFNLYTKIQRSGSLPLLLSSFSLFQFRGTHTVRLGPSTPIAKTLLQLLVRSCPSVVDMRLCRVDNTGPGVRARLLALS